MPAALGRSGLHGVEYRQALGGTVDPIDRSDAVPFFQMYERMWMLDFARATSSANASNTRSVYEGRSVSGVERDIQTLRERLIESFARGRYRSRYEVSSPARPQEAKPRIDPTKVIHRGIDRITAKRRHSFGKRTATKRRECLAREMPCIKT